MPDDPKPAIAYVRQSLARPNESAADALSLEAQEDAIHGWARRSGYRIVGIVRDHDEVGRSMQRPGLQELRDRIAGGQTVAVWKYDRLARNLLGQEQVVQEIEGKGASVVSTTEPTGKFARQMLGTVAEYYSDQLSERLQSVTHTRVKRGLHVGATPYGYDRPGRVPYVDKRGRDKVRHSGPLIPHPEQAPIVAGIFARWTAGDSLRAVANDLNQRGIAAPHGDAWTSQTVAWVLRNPVYGGGVRIKSLIVWDALHEPIVARSVWDDAQTRFARAVTVRRKAGGSWCEGLTVHACGQRMLMNMVSRPGGARYPSFRCSSVARVDARRCTHPRRHIGAPLLERAVRACLARDLADVRPLADAMAHASRISGATETELLRTELMDARAEQLRLRGRARQAWIADGSEIGVWEAERAVYDREIAAIDRRLADLPAPPDVAEFARAAALIASIADLIAAADDAVVREAVAELGLIVVSGDGVRIDYWPRYRAYIPAPVTIAP